MNRRDFLKTSVGSSAFMMLPVAMMAKPKPKIMMLDAFCRDKLKVRLNEWQLDWVRRFDGGVGPPYAAFGAHYIEYDKYAKTLRFSDYGIDTQRIFLAVCVALWAVHTHECQVWWHGDENDFWEIVYVKVQNHNRGDRLWTREVYELGYRIMAYDERIVGQIQPGDFHIYV